MSDPIREQVSAFLDGELPDSEAELLLKRLTRDPELRQSFGRYALIGEAIRGQASPALSAGFAQRLNRAIDGEPAVAVAPPGRTRGSRWWRPFAGAAVAAGVAAVAVVALQQRAVTPLVAAGPRVPSVGAPLVARSAARGVGGGSVTAVSGKPREALSYTVPAVATALPAAMPAARFTSYVFAHSQYSSVLGQSNVLSGLLTADDADPSAGAPPQDARKAP